MSSCDDYNNDGCFELSKNITDCPNGCQNGKCMQATPQNNNITIQNTTTQLNKSGFGSGSSLPSENPCLDIPQNYWDQEDDSCKQGYSDSIIASTCSDPDGGQNMFEIAHTYGFRSVYANEKDKRIRTGGLDSCINDLKVFEHYCDKYGYIRGTEMNCPNGCNKEKGACYSC